MAQIMEMEIFDASSAAGIQEGIADGPEVHRENSVRSLRLAADNLPRIVSSHAQQRNDAVIAILLSRIFPISDQQAPRGLVKVCPLNAADFAATHRRCDRKANNVRNLWLELRAHSIKFILCRTPIAFVR